MNYKNIDPEKEYKLMSSFLMSGGNLDGMPEELRRIRLIWKRADELIRKTPFYNNERIAQLLLVEFPEYEMGLSTAKNHVTAAKKYFDSVETETPATHRRILTDILYKQIVKLNAYQAHSPVQTAKAIAEISKMIASINHLFEKEEKNVSQEGETFIIVSSNDNDFPDIPHYTKKELFKIIDEISNVIDISETEKQKIIDKDVHGKLL